jgi:hypothetical protein
MNCIGIFPCTLSSFQGSSVKRGQAEKSNNREPSCPNACCQVPQLWPSACAVMMHVELLIGLVIGYPAMLWAVGGGWWGLIGMALHLALLLKVRYGTNRCTARCSCSAPWSQQRVPCCGVHSDEHFVS